MPRKPIILITIALAIAVGVAADLAWRVHTSPKFAVLVAGNVIGALRQEEIASKALGVMLAQLTPEMQAEAKLPEKMAVRPLERAERRLHVTTAEEIQRALAGTIPSLAYASAITVDGEDVVAVADEKVAKSVRDAILDEYKATVLRDASAIEQLKFQEKIDWHPKVVPAERVRTLEEAVSILKHGTDKMVTYAVKQGDTGWDIARSYNVSLEQLAKANPTVNLEALQIDQPLNVTFADPYLHTQSVSKRVVKEAIPFSERIVDDTNLWPWQYQVVTPGVPGSRELTIREYRENGMLVKTEVIENKVLDEPKQQVSKHGTKQIPDMGTGSLVYPVVGTITSYFGPRWGTFHSAIDIGAPTGTPILAADSGVVIFRGWDGNYGYMLKIDHGGGKTVTWYAHLNSFARNVGDTVSKGEVIGYVGNTGFSTGPHLHYEVRVNGSAVDPLTFYQ